MKNIAAKKSVVTRKTIIISAIALLLAGITVGGASAFWFPFKWSDNNTTNALQNGNYQAYMNAIEAGWQRYKATITPDVFNLMSARFKNMNAARINQQYTLKAIDNAIHDNNYLEWLNATGNLTKKPSYYANITAENFAIYVKLYNAEKAGDWNAIQQYSEQLGIARTMHFRSRRHGWKPW